MKTGDASPITPAAPAGALARFWEWLWRAGAVAAARSGARSVDADAVAAAARARTLAALAERHLAEREPWTHGEGGTPADPTGVALSLYRDAALDALDALGEEDPVVRAALVARVPSDDRSLPPDGMRRELDAVRARVRSGLAEFARRRGDVEPLYAQRFARVGTVLLAAVALALAPRALWYVGHPDMAPDAPWTASSAAVGYAISGRGFTPPDFKVPVFFHTVEQPSPAITFELGKVVDVRAVTVVNRGDCCGERAVPMVVELSRDNTTWLEAGRRTANFGRWEARFAPTAARWVRLRVTRTTHLHLESVAIR